MAWAKNTNGGIGKVPASRTARSSVGKFDIGAVPASARGTRVMDVAKGLTNYSGPLKSTGLVSTNHVVTNKLPKKKVIGGGIGRS